MSSEFNSDSLLNGDEIFIFIDQVTYAPIGSARVEAFISDQKTRVSVCFTVITDVQTCQIKGAHSDFTQKSFEKLGPTKL